MTDELDIVRYIRLQKQSRFAVKTIFSRLQLWLLQNQKIFVINKSSDSSDANSTNECPPHTERILRQEEDLLTFKKLLHNAVNRKQYIEQQVITKDKEEQEEENNVPDFLQTANNRKTFLHLKKSPIIFPTAFMQENESDDGQNKLIQSVKPLKTIKSEK